MSKTLTQSNQSFILPQQPSPKDKRPRNAFGYLREFGKAYCSYYKKLEKEKR